MPSPYKLTFNYVNSLYPPVGPTLFDPGRLVFIQNSFQGGMNQIQDATRINTNQYHLLVNGRVRSGVVKPIKNIFQLPDAPPGNLYQGFYAAGSFLLLFVDGRAYYKDTSQVGATFQLVTPAISSQGQPSPSFQMSPAAPRIYAELVPASTVNFLRQLATAATPSSGTNLTTAVSGSVQCIICQDGVTQPWLIFNDGTCRQALTYDQWTLNTAMEYIPVGTITKYINGTTYVVNGNIIYLSIVGRPCDFVINVDVNGDKAGDATTTSIAASYEDVTCIYPLNNSTGAFLVATANNTFTMTPDFTNTIFSEPLYDTVFLYNDGVINDKSFINFSGNSAYIDYASARSFNAVQQERFSGKNDPFSKSIQRIVDGVIQQPQSCCIGQYDNYDLFALNTVYGYAVLVYDEMLSQFVSVDIFPEINGVDSYITQFAVVKSNGYYSLYFITNDNLAYQYYGDPKNFALCQLYPAEFTSLEPKVEQKPNEIKLVFIDTAAVGSVSVSLTVDGILNSPLQKAVINASPSNPGFPLGVLPTSGKNTNKLTFALDDSSLGFKVGVLISWNFDAALSHIRLESIPELTEVSDDQAAANYATNN